MIKLLSNSFEVLRLGVCASAVGIFAAPTQSDEPPAPIQEFLPAEGNVQDGFGTSVAISGSTAVIGVPFDDGSAEDSGGLYIFSSPDGQFWPAAHDAHLLVADAEFNDRLGVSVDIEGDLIVAGASYANPLGDDSGAVYVFRKQGSQWTQEAMLTPADGSPSDRFGSAVSLSGNRLVVAARSHEGGSVTGAAYVFRYHGNGTWIEEQKILPPPGAGNFFPSSVSISGDRMVLGNSSNSWNGSGGTGAAYVFRRDGVWVEEALLTDENGAANDLFGASVAISGDVIAVGAYKDDDRGASSGSVFMFRRDGVGDWIHEAHLTATEASASQFRFGESVSLEQNAVLIGAPGHGEMFSSSRGAAYYCRFDGTNWNHAAFLTALSPAAGDNFGDSVAIFGPLLLAGAPGAGAPGVGFDAGIARLFADPVDTDDIDCNGNGVADVEDILSGSATDCNQNGIPDECDLASGVSDDVNGNGQSDDCETDCNGNGLPDEFEIAQDPGADCNGNGALDSCDIAAGTSSDANSNGVVDECEQDCNGNGVADVIDIADGSGTDCDEDGVLDECQGSTLITASSGQLSPFGDGIPQAFVMDPIAAFDDVELTITTSGDFSSQFEYASIDINGLPFGTILEDASDCATEVVTVIISQDDFNATLLGQSAAVITLTPSAQVNAQMCSGMTVVEVDVTYSGSGMNDANGNGVPDECESGACPGDTDGNGVVDSDDIVNVVLDYGGIGDANDDGADGDVDGIPGVDVDDIVFVVLRFGQTCP